MKFSCSVEIDLPRSKVIALWEDPENLPHWQRGFVSFRPLNGKEGAVGSTAEFVFRVGESDKTFKLKETITEHNLPDSFAGIYESNYTLNSMSNQFVVLDGGRTRWDAQIHYTEFRGLMMKIMSKLRGGMFKKQTQDWMDRFKSFAEGQQA